MGDSKKRFLIVPDEAWAEATLVSATSQAGLTVKQPEEDTALGDLRVVVSGEPTAALDTTLYLTREGVVGDAEFTYEYPGTTRNAALRQSPMVVGSRVDILETKSGPDSSPTALRYFSTPQAVESSDGEALLVLYLNSSTKPLDRPLWEEGTITVDGAAAGSGGSVLHRVALSDSAEWGTPVELYPTYSLVPGDTSVFAYDAVLLPVTKTHLLITTGLGNGIVSTHTSDDDLATIRYRSTVNFGTTAIRSLSAAVLPSGRIVTLFSTDREVYAAVSDDNGLSWTSTEILDYRESSTSNRSPISQVSLICAPNGVLCASVAYVALESGSVESPAGSGFVDRIAPNNEQRVAIYTSISGESWSGGTISAREAMSDVATVLLPEGHVATIASMLASHYLPAGYEVRADPYLCFRAWEPWDQNMVTEPQAVVPAGPYAQGAGTWWPFHLFHTSPYLPFGYNAISSDTDRSAVAAYFGHTCGVAAISWKGALWVFSGVAREIDSGVYAGGSANNNVTSLQTGLLALRTAYTHNALEQCTFIYEIEQATSGQYAEDGHVFTFGRVYNSVWDAWDDPENHGYEKASSGSALPFFATVASGDNQGGYMQSTASATDTLYWKKYHDSFPNKDGAQSAISGGEALNGMVRVIVKGEAGGSTLSEETALKLALADDGLGEHVELSVRFEVSGSKLLVSLYDVVAATPLASATVEDAANAWVELLLSTSETTGLRSGTRAVRCDAAARILDDSGAQYLTPFEFLWEDKALTLGGAGDDYLAFGHFSVLSTNVSWYWKGVHLHRGTLRSDRLDGTETPLLQSQGTDWLSGGALFSSPTTVGKNPTGLQPFSSRVCNQQWGNRPMQGVAYPQFFLENTALSFVGRAIAADGTFPIATGYTFGWESVYQNNPVAKEFRTEDTDEHSVLLNTSARPTGTNQGRALAVFGRNTPAIRLQMNDTDAWGSSTIDVTITDPVTGDPWGASRVEYAHLWASDKDFVCISTANGIAVRHVTNTGPGPWRFDQFASQETGQQFYVVATFTGVSGVYVYKVLGNTDSLLRIEDYLPPLWPVTSLPVDKIAVISDRFAFDLSDLFEAEVTPTDPYPAFNYTKITFGSFNSGAEQHHKLGALWFGRLHDLSEPDFEWQWRRTTESGYTLTDTPAGPTYGKRNRQFRRTFTANKPIMKSALVSNGLDSPETQIRGSWEETINLLERLEVDGTRCALIWQGERAEAGAQVDPTQRTSDPLELIACRVTSAGTLQNDAYSCQTMNLASSGETSVLRPRASMSSISFREEF